MTQDERPEVSVQERDIHLSDLLDTERKEFMTAAAILGKLIGDTLKEWDHVTFAKDERGNVRWIAPPHSHLDPAAFFQPGWEKKFKLVRRVLTDGKRRYAMVRNGELWQVELDDDDS